MADIVQSYVNVLRYLSQEAKPDKPGERRPNTAWATLSSLETENLLHLLGVMYVEILCRVDSGEIKEDEGGAQFRAFAQQLLQSDFGATAWANAKARRPPRQVK